MRFDFVTIFPGMFEPLLAEGIIARGVKQGLLDAHVWDLRDFATDKHRSTDDFRAVAAAIGVLIDIAVRAVRVHENCRACDCSRGADHATRPT